MALNKEENKIDNTMELIPDAGFPIGYANLMRVTIDWQGNFAPELRRYFSKEYRENNEYSFPPHRS